MLANDGVAFDHPASWAKANEDGVAHPENVRVVQMPTTAQTTSCNEVIRILVAEDDRTNRMVAVGQLKKLGYDADYVGNGLEVLNSLNTLPYDVILMDCQMPEMDGYQATRAISEREKSLDNPCRWRAPIYIIAMTAHAMQGDREKCFAVGMDDYLSKPVPLAELKAVLGRR
jgi:two-component system sensor histidine kinase/response regulator